MKKYIKNSSILEKELDGEKVLFNPDKNKVYSLNFTATLVWDSCEQKCTKAEILARIKRGFSEVPEDVDRDIENILENFCLTELLKCTEV